MANDRRLTFHPFVRGALPEDLQRLAELALDLRWTWSHAGDRLWHSINPEMWARTKNPWLMLQSMSPAALEKLTRSPRFGKELHELLEARDRHSERPSWAVETGLRDKLGTVAFFSMEFGIGEALPLYAGGLGILAGDFLKTASDLEIPVVGVGLLYGEGYFRQAFDSGGWQLEAYPYNDPVFLPISPSSDSSGAWLRVPLELPGRTLWLRVWQVQVGKVNLHLVDSNDPLNHPFDRGITSKLYPDRPEIRLVQEMALGIGGWRTLKALGIGVEVCHLNEGHAALVVLERARDFMKQTGVPFNIALCATRAGNIFTTHTPVESGFDRFGPELIGRYLGEYARSGGFTLDEVMTLGRRQSPADDEPLNMAYLAARGSARVNGVSRLHETVSRRIFQPLYPRWPEHEVPVQHITNGVHMPSWDSQAADELWTRTCGKERWLHTLEHIRAAMENASDEDLWNLRSKQSEELVSHVRERLAYQYGEYGANRRQLGKARSVLDMHVLTLGFARRFTAYKRPDLVLADPERLAAIITSSERPVQLIVAGKAHPADDEGKRIAQRFIAFSERRDVQHRVVYLEDYDLDLAQRLVQGVDVWLNTPRRTWEACGTSGMKVLINGGLNLSELDGWWAEAYSPDVGWAIGDETGHSDADRDRIEATRLYERLEQDVVPDFYSRDASGIPRRWVARMRASMARLSADYSSNRMLREYVEKVYVPVAELFRQRTANRALLAAQIMERQSAIRRGWAGMAIERPTVARDGDELVFTVVLGLGGLEPQMIRVELYADALRDGQPTRIPMTGTGAVPDRPGFHTYTCHASATRPSDHYTVRVYPAIPGAVVPLEDTHILWQR